MALVRVVADLVVASALETAGKGAKKLDEKLVLLEMPLATALNTGVPFKDRWLLAQELAAQATRMTNAGKPAGSEDRRPFHWVIEFPEVFTEEGKRGFDAIVGNPPFMGGLKLQTAYGTDWRAFLVEHLANGVTGVRGTGDLCAYFFLRANKLLHHDGAFGLIATNTIAQGDSREIGLDQLVVSGAQIVRARPSAPWPGTANLEIAEVWVKRGGWNATRVLNDQDVAIISPHLVEGASVQGRPNRLKANEGRAFTGSFVMGLGFLMSPKAAAELIERNRANAAVLQPYLNGEDLNSHWNQEPSRWAINFRDWPLERSSAPEDYTGPVAADFPDCLAIIREKVKPERDKMMGRNSMATRRGSNWWRYAGEARFLYQAISEMKAVLSLSLVGNHVSVARVGTGKIFANKLCVFAFEQLSWLALLQCSFHYCWSWEYSSTMRTDLNYAPTACFETFPFPTLLDGLDGIGERYHTHRASIMVARKEGLTKTCNRFHDPKERAADISQLRSLHVEMDHAVADAYGWKDLDLGHGFRETKQGVRYMISDTARREVLARLLRLNHTRYAEEVAAGLHDKGKKAKGQKASAPIAEAESEEEAGEEVASPKRPRGQPKKGDGDGETQGSLFSEEDE